MPLCSITKLLVCKLARIDDELAASIEHSYGDLATYRTHPEVAVVITTLYHYDIEIAIVSDFHVDPARTSHRSASSTTSLGSRSPTKWEL